MIDALLFMFPTPFVPWGVVAMWAVFATAVLALLRWPLRLPPRVWRLAHSMLALVIVVGSVVDALLVQGTMGTASKYALATLVVAATLKLLYDKRVWTLLWRARFYRR